MRVFAIGDLHMLGGDDKPMDVFGAHWENHVERIFSNWRERVQPEDIVLIPGDISWAMSMEKALPDLQQIGALPGRKIILRGNHDYWWSSVSHLRDVLPKGMFAIQNDALLLDSIAFCGSRGWTIPAPDHPEDEKIYARELIRLELSLERAKRLSASRIVVMMHYPPLGTGGAETAVSRLLASYHVDDVVYGHLHGLEIKKAVQGEFDGVRYHFVSSDGLQFQLYQLPEA